MFAKDTSNTACVGVGLHRLSLRLPYLGVFPGVFPFTLLHLSLNFTRVSSLRLMYLHPSVDPSLIHFLSEFPGIGTGSGTRWCGPRGGTVVRMEQKSCFNI